MNTITQSEIELSERLRKACLEKGITEPRFVAQDAGGRWWHFFERPLIYNNGWSYGFSSVLLFATESTQNWRETLMEWNSKAGVPLADVLQNTCEHCGQRI